MTLGCFFHVSSSSAKELIGLRADHNNVQKELQELKEKNQKAVSSTQRCNKFFMRCCIN